MLQSSQCQLFCPDKCSFHNVEQVDNGFGGSDGMLLVTTLPEDANVTGIIEINAISLGSGTGLTGNATICKLEFLSNFHWYNIIHF